MPNLLQEFRALFPRAPVLVGEIVAVSAGVVSVELPGGAVIAARGEGAVGMRVFVRDGAVEGEAPDLPFVLVEV